MKKYLGLVFIIALFSCGNNENSNTETTKDSSETNNKAADTKVVSEGYKLMEQKCFSCHFAKPDPSKRGQMLAPPMLRVQEHYKPNYSNKEEFVAAITEWVQNPKEENTLMPGAIRKFNVMPNLNYDEAEVKLIAEALFDTDFGNMPKMQHKGMHKSLTLNNGEKWKVKTETMEQIKKVSKQLEEFSSEDLSKFNTLGKDVFDNAKFILMDKSYTDETFEMLHSFFNNVEGNIHNLIAAKDLSTAKEEYSILLKKFSKFEEYFEADEK